MNDRIQYIGSRILRREDRRLLIGRGQYLDEVRLAGMYTAAFVRSPYAHARILSIDTRGLARAFTASDLANVGPISPYMADEGFRPTSQWPLARERVRYVGEPVAVVLGPDRYAAEDLADKVDVKYAPLEVIGSIEAALAEHTPRLHSHSRNVLYHRTHVAGDPAAAFRKADITIRTAVNTSRTTAVPLEGRGVVAWLVGDVLTVWTSSQTPSLVRSYLASVLNLPEHSVRVIVPDTGGGFGQKMHLYPEEVVVAALAFKTRHPVKWVEDRRENLMAATQSREERVEAEIAAMRGGKIVGLQAKVFGDVGAYHVYPTTAALEPLGVAQILPGPYAISDYGYEVLAVCTNKPATGAYRGVGLPVGVFVMERLMDKLARALGLDPVEVRLRNLIPVEEIPYQSASGLVYDSGSFREALERVCQLADYPALRERQRQARAEGRYIGIGISCYTEYTSMGSSIFARRGMIQVPGHEAASIRVDRSGTTRVALSFPSQGQGHETVMAQIVAETLQLPLDGVRVEQVDTAASPHGSGTFASRSAVAGGGAVFEAARMVRDKACAIAASILEASPSDIELTRGKFYVRGSPQRTVTLVDVVRAASHVFPREGGMSATGLDATAYYDPPSATFSNAAHLVVIEVDAETGLLRLVKYWVVEDCGRLLNPLIVEGQIHGALAQGIGGALLEHLAYDVEGQPLTTTLMDYSIPTALEMPPVEIVHLDHPARGRPGGAKGMGEGGTIGAPAALANAVSDAVEADVVELPLKPGRVRALIREAQSSRPKG